MSVGRGVCYPKTRTSECLSIDMVDLNKRFDLELESEEILSWKISSGKYSIITLEIEPPGFIRLIYTINNHSGEKTEMNYRVYLTTTECNYGGERYWFNCPQCGRRCRIIYKHPRGYWFTCRICNNLTYASQQEGYPRWKAMQDAVFKLPEWQHQYYRAKSEKKRRRLLRKMNRVTGGLQAIIDWGRRLDRGRKK